MRQLITLPNLRIIDYVVGHCGSAHDATVFRSARTYMSSRDLFEPGEWIWADSAYALDSWCVTPYKKPLSNRPENKKFNYHLSRVCNSLFLLHAIVLIWCPIGACKVGACNGIHKGSILLIAWTSSTN